MELNEAEKMALQFNKKARDKFAGKADDFCIVDVIDNPNHRAFSVEFEAYNYFLIRMNYDKERVGWCISFGSKGIVLENSQK